MERTIVNSPAATPNGAPGTGLGVGVGLGLGLGLGAGVAAVTGMLLAPVKNDSAADRRSSDLRRQQIEKFDRDIGISATQLYSANRKSDALSSFAGIGRIPPNVALTDGMFVRRVKVLRSTRWNAELQRSVVEELWIQPFRRLRVGGSVPSTRKFTAEANTRLDGASDAVVVSKGRETNDVGNSCTRTDLDKRVGCDRVNEHS